MITIVITKKKSNNNQNRYSMETFDIPKSIAAQKEYLKGLAKRHPDVGWPPTLHKAGASLPLTAVATDATGTSIPRAESAWRGLLKS